MYSMIYFHLIIRKMKYFKAGLLASVLVNSIQISGDHFLDCKSWLGMAGNGRHSVLYQLKMASTDCGWWVWEFPPILVSRDAAAEGRASLVRLTLPSHQMITTNLPILHNLTNEEFNVYGFAGLSSGLVVVCGWGDPDTLLVTLWRQRPSFICE